MSAALWAFPELALQATTDFELLQRHAVDHSSLCDDIILVIAAR